MPDNQSREKIDLLQTLGAEVRAVPVVPWSDPANYNHQAREYAESLDNAVWTNQFDNTANRQAHIEVISFLVTCISFKKQEQKKSRRSSRAQNILTVKSIQLQ